MRVAKHGTRPVRTKLLKYLAIEIEIASPQKAFEKEFYVIKVNQLNQKPKVLFVDVCRKHKKKYYRM